MKPIVIHYYAILREQRGCSTETLQTDAAPPRELYREIYERHRFTVPQEQLKVAINDEFADWSAALQGGDEVVFLSPVAGG